MDSSSPEQTLEELQVFEGVRASGSGRRRQLSSEDITSGRYKRTRSRLSDILHAGSLRSLQQQHQSSFEEPCTSPSSPSSPKVEPPPRRQVSWNPAVDVYFHEMILGYNCSVSSGAPVEIAWDKFHNDTAAVNEQYSRPTSRMKLAPGVRMRLCRLSGASAVEVMSRIEAVEIQRQQHAASVKLAKMEERKASKEAQKASGKNNQQTANNKHEGQTQSSCECCIL